MSATVVPIHTLYLDHARQLRREHDALRQQREYTAAYIREKQATAVERRGIEIRDRMGAA